MSSRYDIISISAERAAAANDIPSRFRAPGYNLAEDFQGGGGAMRVARRAALHGDGKG